MVYSVLHSAVSFRHFLQLLHCCPLSLPFQCFYPVLPDFTCIGYDIIQSRVTWEAEEEPAVSKPPINTHKQMCRKETWVVYVWIPTRASLQLFAHLHLHEGSPVETACCSRQGTPQTAPLRHDPAPLQTFTFAYYYFFFFIFSVLLLLLQQQLMPVPPPPRLRSPSTLVQNPDRCYKLKQANAARAREPLTAGSDIG